MERIDDDIKQVLFGVHERASFRRMSMSQAEKETMELNMKPKRRASSFVRATPQDPPTLQPSTALPDLLQVTSDPSKLKPTVSFDTAEDPGMQEQSFSIYGVAFS
jgi:hypothetical protein